MTDLLQKILKRNEEYVVFAKEKYNINLDDDVMQQSVRKGADDDSYKNQWDDIFQSKRKKLKKLRQQNLEQFERSCQTLDKDLSITAHSIDLETAIGEPETVVMGEEEESDTYRSQIKRLKGQIDELVDQQEVETQQHTKIMQLLNDTKLKRSYYEWEQQRLHRDEDIVKKQLAELDRELLNYGKAESINDVFPIGYDGHFGTINKFKLGRLSSVPVNWEEINAALGQCVYLLDTLARTNHIEFSVYDLRPCGATSQLASKSAGILSSTLELSARPSGLFWKKAFNKALVAFLSCIKEAGEKAHEKTPNFLMPYTIQQDKINDVSIRFYSDKAVHIWTQALKYMLTNLKSLV
eukprot:CAMPEP_0117429362 /NCGR_PEP_ID=MMETSP0758-20121206/8924_1 /TAXON_ID=63605 /ORGANISM="Percolomonas cosmopolitus, Strain AE-1 (ATCC 50343)" /LENGTH=351 /DNA_ID=CAMNT_0005216351 /DNA_START=88 /DNA_END=1140 /DNA_ORIENTATION=-